MAIVFASPQIPREFIEELNQYFNDITITSMEMSENHYIKLQFNTPIGCGTFHYETQVTQWSMY